MENGSGDKVVTYFSNEKNNRMKVDSNIHHRTG